ncbi:MAG: biotin synthase, partial [Pygmaiobacter sp.]
RVPGIGPVSAKRIVLARRSGKLDDLALKRIGVVLKRAQYFITCNGRTQAGLALSPTATVRALLDKTPMAEMQQMSLFELSAQEAQREAVACFTKAM